MNQQAKAPASSADRAVHFCSGKYCPGYHWRASNVPHPSSCVLERLNSEQNLRDAAASRRAHCREVFWVPSSSDTGAVR